MLCTFVLKRKERLLLALIENRRKIKQKYKICEVDRLDEICQVKNAHIPFGFR